MTLPTGGAALMIVCLAALAAAARDQPSHGHPPADLVLDGGVVVTLDDAHPRATALAVRRGRIVAVGGPADVKPFLGKGTRKVHLAGRTVVPGLTDAHVHVEGLGTALERLDLVGAASLEEALARVAAAVKKAGAGTRTTGPTSDSPPPQTSIA